MKCLKKHCLVYTQFKATVLSFQSGTEVLLESAHDAKYDRSLVHTLFLLAISRGSSCGVLTAWASSQCQCA